MNFYRNARVTLDDLKFVFEYNVDHDPIQSFHINADGSVYANEALGLDLEPTPDGTYEAPDGTHSVYIGQVKPQAPRFIGVWHTNLEFIE